jgi:hypothetical protein
MVKLQHTVLDTWICKLEKLTYNWNLHKYTWKTSKLWLLSGLHYYYVDIVGSPNTATCRLFSQLSHNGFCARHLPSEPSLDKSPNTSSAANMSIRFTTRPPTKGGRPSASLSSVRPPCVVLPPFQHRQRHDTENSKQIFPEKELNCLSPNSYIHVSVSDLYIPTISLPILLQEKRWTDPGNIWIAHRYMNVEIGTKAPHFFFWEHINRN